ncbi:hypothetical protein BV898_00271 [Hypsibius exemplaris]|uniref:Uncharacterized protein n=1 Tax=Hypsibius exemplaris TaxID=2072580 RepID=A0A1W0XF86_HYPEX|nr:hypothetical protein BV898_00271 [Hypsibius exemplaris]
MPGGPGGWCYRLYCEWMTLIGAGLWDGAFFIAAGIVGCIATRPNPRNDSRKGLFIDFLVMSILSAVLNGALPIVGAIIFFGTQFDNLPLRVSSLLVYASQLVFFIITASFGCCNVSGGGRSQQQPFHGTVVYQVQGGGEGLQQQPQIRYYNGPSPPPQQQQQQLQRQPYPPRPAPQFQPRMPSR